MKPGKLAKLASDQRHSLTAEHINNLASAPADISPPTASPDRYRELLQGAILTALEQANRLPYRSSNDAMSSAIKGIEAMQKLYPVTMEEAAEWLVRLPNFEPRRFAEVLKRVWDCSR